MYCSLNLVNDLLIMELQQKCLELEDDERFPPSSFSLLLLPLAFPSEAPLLPIEKSNKSKLKQESASQKQNKISPPPHLPKNIPANKIMIYFFISSNFLP